MSIMILELIKYGVLLAVEAVKFCFCDSQGVYVHLSKRN